MMVFIFDTEEATLLKNEPSRALRKKGCPLVGVFRERTSSAEKIRALAVSLLSNDKSVKPSSPFSLDEYEKQLRLLAKQPSKTKKATFFSRRGEILLLLIED